MGMGMGMDMGMGSSSIRTCAHGTVPFTTMYYVYMYVHVYGRTYTCILDIWMHHSTYIYTCYNTHTYRYIRMYHA